MLVLAELASASEPNAGIGHGMWALFAAMMAGIMPGRRCSPLNPTT
jgi:hypothetical protein